MHKSIDRIKQEEIPGFKVMEWLAQVREEEYKLRKEDPERYTREMESLRKEMRKRFSGKRKSSGASS
jgi:hypothetical protein